MHEVKGRHANLVERRCGSHLWLTAPGLRFLRPPGTRFPTAAPPAQGSTWVTAPPRRFPWRLACYRPPRPSERRWALGAECSMPVAGR